MTDYEQRPSEETVTSYRIPPVIDRADRWRGVKPLTVQRLYDIASTPPSQTDEPKNRIRMAKVLSDIRRNPTYSPELRMSLHVELFAAVMTSEQGGEWFGLGFRDRPIEKEAA